MADLIYNRFFYNLGAGLINLATDDLVACLLTSDYSPNKDHNVYADLTNEVVNGNGYATGGKSLTGKVWTEDDGGDLAWLDAEDVQWAPATITARYVVIYDNTLAGKDLCFCFDMGANITSTNDIWKCVFNVLGLYRQGQV